MQISKANVRKERFNTISFQGAFSPVATGNPKGVPPFPWGRLGPDFSNYDGRRRGVEEPVQRQPSPHFKHVNTVVRGFRQGSKRTHLMGLH